MTHTSTRPLGIIVAMIASLMFLASSTAQAHADYSFELTTVQPWTDAVTTDPSTTYVNARVYVAGSKSWHTASVPVYKRTTTSNANALGDIVGYEMNVYGPSPAFVDPYDAPKYYLTNPIDGSAMSATLVAVNDDRLAIGTFQLSRAPFVYDLIYKKYTQLPLTTAGWTTFADINAHGQVTGMVSPDNGATRYGFVYDCAQGQTVFSVPTARWTVPVAIDDTGAIYGTFTSTEHLETYFIARPNVAATTLQCKLVPRDDVSTPATFSTKKAFDMSGDQAFDIRIADFDKGGANDILVAHGEGKSILYKGEGGFKTKVKWSGYTTLDKLIAAKYPGVAIAAWNDLNGDGTPDQVRVETPNLHVSLGKADGTYYYVSQTIRGQRLADLNGDGYLDVLEAVGGTMTIRYQDKPVTPAPTVVAPVVAPVTESAPVPDTTVTTPTTVTEPIVLTEPTVPVTETLQTTVAPETTTPSSTTFVAVPETNNDPYTRLLQEKYPGMQVIKLNMEDDGSAQFKISFEGATIEGTINPSITTISIIA